jgi:protoheme IX farnesyltransferase
MQSTRTESRFRRNLLSYVALTKPRIIELLLATTLPALFLASGGWPNLWVATATLLGGAMAAGGANVLNNVLDRDIDSVMPRTHGRSLVTGSISVVSATSLGVVLSVISVAWFAAFTTPLASVLAAAAIVSYVVGYTMILKRRTASNIVWGGIAGCFPVLIGWAAVTGSLSWTALIFFVLIFFWTPAHYWPLAVSLRDDYELAGVPMLPVVARPKAVVNKVIAYTVATLAASLVLYFVAGLGVIYLAGAIILGAWFSWAVWRLRSLVVANPEMEYLGLTPSAMKVFHVSIAYLAGLSLVICLDVVI